MQTAAELVGSVRRFGPAGPPYEVVRVAPPMPDGELQMRIHVLESDEDLDYPMAAIVGDPVAD